MRNLVSAFLMFAFAAVKIAGAAEAANSPTLLAAADSNDARVAIPQLSADTNAWAQLPRLIETNQPVKPRVSVVQEPTPPQAQPWKNLWMILAVLAVFGARFLLRRLRSRSGPSGGDPK
ncbi:MAG: hypothetical protein WCQ21_13960 [Verrucomicrobiota bacterium]|jgi:hypothetical protein